MTVKERLICFIKSNHLGQGAFEKLVGLSNGYVNNIRVSIQPDKLQKIALKFPELNTGWLLTGEGEMLREKPSCQPASVPNDENISIKNLWDLIVRQQETIKTANDSLLALQQLAIKQQENIDRLLTTVENLLSNVK